jgi:hypothetical protein
MIGATFMNPKLITDIKPAAKPLKMVTNAGTKSMTHEATVKGFNEKAYFDKDQLANILGFSNLVDKFRIVYDSWEEDAFKLHTQDGIVKFHRTPEGLYAFDPTACDIESLNCLVRTVAEKSGAKRGLPVPLLPGTSSTHGLLSCGLI